MNRREALRTIAAGSAAGALAGGMAMMAIPSVANASAVYAAADAVRSATRAREAFEPIYEAWDEARTANLKAFPIEAPSHAERMAIRAAREKASGYTAAEERWNGLCEAETEAMRALIACPVTTLAEVRAKVSAMRDWHLTDYDDDAMGLLLASLPGGEA